MLLCAVCTGLCACTAGTSSVSTPAVGSSSAPVSATETYSFNPLTGETFAAGQDANTRPVAIMVNNVRAAYPQSGIAAADVIYEMVTEGGITRLMAVYPSLDVVPDPVGPVRSARDQFVQLMLPLNALYVHIGSSIYADNLLNEYKYQDIDGMYLGSTSFVFLTERSHTYANEHCWYTNSALIRAGIEKNVISTAGSYNKLFNFSTAKVTPAAGEATNVMFYYSPNYAVGFTYDAATGTYLKSSFGAPHIDSATGTQLAFKNVVLLYTDITLKPDGNCTEFALSKGKGVYITNGQYQDITWEKAGVFSELKLFDADGKELAVNTGKSYIGVLGNTQVHTLEMNSEVTISALEGWVEESGQKHYYRDNLLVSGITVIDGIWYNFDENGNITPGWADYNGQKMYFNEGGGIVTGEVVIDGKTYNFGSDGVLVE